MKTRPKLGGILLIAGTSIGAGMLAMPLSTQGLGMGGSIALFIAIWAVMVYSAFLLLEASLWFKEPINLVSLAKEKLGRAGSVAVWCCYLLLLYALMSAYIVGSSTLIDEAIAWAFDIKVIEPFSALALLILFGAAVFLGTRGVDYVNRLLMLGLVIAYGVLIFFAFSNLKKVGVMTTPSSFHFTKAIGVVFTSFGYQIIIPTLVSYLDRNLKTLKLCLWVGSLIPLGVYIAWNSLVLYSTNIDAHAGDESAASVIKALMGAEYSSVVVTACRFFSFFAMTTSFLGVSTSLADFLMDALRLPRKNRGRAIACLIAFLPPLLMGLWFPYTFVKALEFAGVIVALLLVLFPALVVYLGRSKHAGYKVIGGKPALLFVMAISLLFVICEFIK